MSVKPAPERGAAVLADKAGSGKGAGLADARPTNAKGPPRGTAPCFGIVGEMRSVAIVPAVVAAMVVTAFAVPAAAPAPMPFTAVASAARQCRPSPRRRRGRR